MCVSGPRWHPWYFCPDTMEVNGDQRQIGLHRIFKISSFVFNRRNKLIQTYNLRVSLRICIFGENTNVLRLLQKRIVLNIFITKLQYIYQMLKRRTFYFTFFIFFCQYVCSLGIEPTTFCAANTMLYHWATGTIQIKYITLKGWLCIMHIAK